MPTHSMFTHILVSTIRGIYLPIFLFVVTAAKVVSEVPERALPRGGHIASGSHLTGASGVLDNITTVIETSDDGPGSQSNIALLLLAVPCPNKMPAVHSWGLGFVYEGLT